MKATGLGVKRVELGVPGPHAPRARHEGEALATSMLTHLADSLRQRELPAGSLSLDTLRVRIPREQATAQGIAHAIEASIAHALATARKQGR